MKRMFLVIAAVTCLAAKSTQPSALIAQINKDGARAVVQQLWQDESVADSVCGEIESGDSAWLEVARRLRPGSDAAAAESLDFSVARAIPRAPTRVLKLIKSGDFPLDMICTSPYIEPEPGVAEQYQQRAVEALKRVSEPSLRDVRDKCLAKLGTRL